MTEKIATTDGGAPVPSVEHSLSVGPDGPILLQDHYLIEQMANFNRERIPERQPHAKGGGAFGHFEVTDDVSQYTKAAFLQPGAKTEMVARFSTVAGERGSPDTWRDPRGFSLKFYTSEGNFDMVGNNTPVFFIRDPMKFQNFIRSQKRMAANNLRDHNMQWDFWTLVPESAHQVTYLMGDRGIPKTWRHMNGYSSHTYSWINAAGELFWVKYHFKTDQGIDFLTQEDADRIAGEDGDYHQRDLFDSIEAGNHPTWTLKMQIMPFEDAKTYRINPFDLTKVWPHADYPLIDVGTMTLNRNVVDYHAQIEQAAFEPNNIVPGTGLTPGQDAAGPRVLLLRRAPRPARGELQADPGQRAEGRGQRVLQGRRDADQARDRPGVRAELDGRPGGRRSDAGGRGALDVRRRHGPHGVLAACRGRRLGPGGHAGPRGHRRRSAGTAGRTTSSATCSDGVKEPVLSRVFEYWRNVDPDLGKKVEEGVRAGDGNSAR